MANVLNELGELCRTQGCYELARPLLERALTIWEQALGPAHPTVVRGLEQYAALLRALQQPTQAEGLEAHAHAI